MNEKTRIQIEEMKRQTIGVEVEMNNITRENAARIAADYFGTGLGHRGQRVEIPKGCKHCRG